MVVGAATEAEAEVEEDDEGDKLAAEAMKDVQDAGAGRTMIMTAAKTTTTMIAMMILARSKSMMNRSAGQ